MDSLIIALIVAVTLLYMPWITVVLAYPLMMLDGIYRNHPCLLTNLMRGPYWIVERLFRGGLKKYVLYNISYIPSYHVRRAAYRGLGAHIAPKVIFCFKTEVRALPKLRIGGGYNHR